MGATDGAKIDFFISRAGADAPFAGEISRILEDDGHAVILQQWDFANRNFIERMQAALASGARVIALLSPDYLASDYCQAEWHHVLATDPLNRASRLIVLRITECAPTGLLTALAYWDLVPIRTDRDLLSDIVRAAVKPGRHKPDDPPPGPYWRAPQTIVHPEIRETSSFTGREAELAAIEAALTAGGAAAVTQPAAVHGLGGIGKSVLAREYAHRFRDRYAGVWWLNAAKTGATQGFDGIESGLVELGAIFIRGLDQAEDRAKAARQTLRFLAEGGFEKPWLLIYDNVDAALVLRAWPPPGNTQVLLTTRLRGWPGSVRAIEIEEWPMADAIAYLHSESGRDDLSAADAEAISAALGRLPLALSHAAAYLRARRNITAAGYLAGLTRRMNQAPADAEYSRAVFATFTAAVEEAESEAPGARDVLSLAAFFAPDAIPEELYRQPPAAYPPPLADLMADPELIDEAIGALTNLSLIDFEPDRRTFSIHRLVQAAARDALAAEVAAWAEGALAVMASAFPVPEFRTWPVCERLVPHIHAVASHVTGDSYLLAWILTATADYLRVRSALSEVLPLYGQALSIFQRFVESDPRNVVWVRGLSSSLDRIGDLNVANGNRVGALKAYEGNTQIIRSLSSSDPNNADWARDLAVSLIKVGDVRVAEGDRSGALKVYEEGGEIIRCHAAADPANASWARDLSVNLDRVGNVRSATGDRAGALKAYEESARIIRCLAASDPSNADRAHDLAVILTKVGSMRLAQGECNDAFSKYEESLAIQRRLATSDLRNLNWACDLATCLIGIGDLRVTNGDSERALMAYEESLAIRSRLTAADPANSAWQYQLGISHERVGDVLMAQGKHALACETYNVKYEIISRLAAADPGNADWARDVALSLNKIGDARLMAGDREGALTAYGECLAIRMRLAAADPGNAVWARDVSVSLERVGNVRLAKGDREGALVAYEEGLGIRRRLAAADPGNAERARDIAVSLEKVGDVRLVKSERKGALTVYEDSLAIRRSLRAADPHNAVWARDLIVSHVKIAEIVEVVAIAREHYALALTLAEDLATTGRLARVDAWLIKEIRQRLASLS